MSQILFEPSDSVGGFIESLEAISREAKSVLVLSCDENQFTPEKVDSSLKALKIPVIGGIFPAILYSGEKYEKGILFVGLDSEISVNCIENISQLTPYEMDTIVEKHIEGYDSTIATMLVFVDGLAKNISESIGVMFDNFGLSSNYIGGGTGSLSFEQKPSLFTNQGLIADALVYAFLSVSSSVGVKHGWKSVKGPFEVTKSKGTIVEELDYRPAFEVYKDVVDGFSKISITSDNFFDLAKSFPLGINKLSGDKIVRDPIVLQDKKIVCVGNVEEGCYVDILHGDSESLVKATGDAKLQSSNQKDFKEDFVLFIDCISRSLFLEELYQKELDAVFDGEGPLVGALTFGEIANDGSEYLEFFNKTSVVGYLGSG